MLVVNSDSTDDRLFELTSALTPLVTESESEPLRFVTLSNFELPDFQLPRCSSSHDSVLLVEPEPPESRVDAVNVSVRFVEVPPMTRLLRFGLFALFVRFGPLTQEFLGERRKGVVPLTPLKLSGALDCAVPMTRNTQLLFAEQPFREGTTETRPERFEIAASTSKRIPAVVACEKCSQLKARWVVLLQSVFN
ncbi:MAG: hypothetical protein ACRCT8_15625 [Lacipirellulaceae bacterium]